jgi:hypothetical protein
MSLKTASRTLENYSWTTFKTRNVACFGNQFAISLKYSIIYLICRPSSACCHLLPIWLTRTKVSKVRNNVVIVGGNWGKNISSPSSGTELGKPIAWAWRFAIRIRLTSEVNELHWFMEIQISALSALFILFYLKIIPSLDKK